MNTGAIIQSPKLFEWRFGGQSAIDYIVLQKDGQWLDYLPTYELQHAREKWLFDSMGCVSFSANNCLEILFRKKYNEDINLSDRFLTKESGTTINGNYFINVANTLRNTGFVYEDDYPFIAVDQDGDSDFDWADFYKEIPKDILIKAKTNKEFWDIHHEWVGIKSVGDKIYGLQLSPIQVAMEFPSNENKNKDGVIQYVNNNTWHAVVLVGYVLNKWWYIFDTYEPFVKMIEWDYPMYEWGMGYDVTKKSMANKPFIQQNSLIFEAENAGRAGLFVDDKIIIDDLSKILLQYEMRNDQFPNRKNLTTEQFNLFPHVDFKGNII